MAGQAALRASTFDGAREELVQRVPGGFEVVIAGHEPLMAVQDLEVGRVLIANRM